jgi:hypothetical protein
MQTLLYFGGASLGENIMEKERVCGKIREVGIVPAVRTSSAEEGRFASGVVAKRGQRKFDVIVRDAKPQLEEWDNYDSESVARCVRESDAVDPKGFAFRYPQHGAEFCRYDFQALAFQMNHIRQVLDGIKNCLHEAVQELNEYEQYLDQEFGRGEYD